MPSFVDYRNNLPTVPYALTPRGRAWSQAFGSVEDAQAIRARRAVRTRYPDFALDGALPIIGADRLLPQGPTESNQDFATRLKRAFALWYFGGTPTGVVQAFLQAGFGSVLNPPRVYTNGDWVTHTGSGTGTMKYACSGTSVTSLAVTISASGTAGVSGSVDVSINGGPPATITPIPSAVQGDEGGSTVGLFFVGDFVNGDTYTPSPPDGNLTLWARWSIVLPWPAGFAGPYEWGEFDAAMSPWYWGGPPPGMSGAVDWGTGSDTSESLFTLIGEISSLWNAGHARFVGAWLVDPALNTTVISPIPASTWNENLDVVVGGQTVDTFFRYATDS